jgi:peptidoglycan/LPS O-acetylase OafA/YrhL
MEKGNRKLAGIQIARALAALSVCYFHSWTILDRFPQGTSYPIFGLAKFGWLGVELFFGISGFVICLVVTKPSFDPGQFLIRRIFRLYPLWLVTLSLWALMAWAWRGWLPTETLANFFYAATLLPTHGFPFYDIGWSLQHEMVFYLLAVLTVPLLGASGLVAILIISIAANHLFQLPWYLSQFASYHSEFLTGILAFLSMPRLRWVGSMAPLVSGAALLFGLLEIGGLSWSWLFPVPLFFFVVGFANLETGFSWNIALGDASYSIYLIHPLVFAIAKSLTKLAGSNLVWLEEPLRFFSIGTVIVLSLLSWRFLEKPTIKAGEMIFPKRKDALLLVH